AIPSSAFYSLSLHDALPIFLLTLIFDDLFGGILNAIHLGFDLGGVSPTPVLLGFVAMFGIGGLFGLHSFGLGPGGATIVGLVSERLEPESSLAHSGSLLPLSRPSRSASPT